MGRMLGAFADDGELDRPDLNKCPDCGCFFADDDCPICGKRCPEEMRAGNRKPVKKRKPKKTGTHYRVAYIDWYHRWWFILLMLAFMPIVGIILLITSPHKKGLKIAVIVIGVVYTILSSVGIGTLIQHAINFWSDPVDTSLSREEYVAACEEVDPEEFYRHADTYKDRFVSLELCVKAKFTDADGYHSGGEYNTYYLCEALDGSVYQIMLRDCLRKDDAQKFVTGALLRVYGEGAGDITVYDMNYVARSAPCVYIAYVDLIG